MTGAPAGRWACTLNTPGRADSLDKLASRTHDALIVGGGVNGAVAALALASHGMSAALVERADFASGVSQESTNLVWGGFKYLQNYEIALVAGLCRSRNLLARAYPSQLVQTRFVATLGETSPYGPAVAALGAYAYWTLGRCATSRPRMISPRGLETSAPTVASCGVRGAVEYSDYVLADNDSRFVMRLILDAVAKGATAVSRARVDAAERAGGVWRTTVTDVISGEAQVVTSRLLVNAAGPAADSLARLASTTLQSRLCLSKGAHLVVPSVDDSGRVLAFFDDDARLFYVLPMGHRSVIGTTDTRVEGPDVEVTDEDRDFLLEQANSRLRLPRPLRADDVIAERCGVRPLVVGDDEDTDRDWTELSRRHELEVDETAKAVSILGGKLSDCLNVGYEVLAAARACGLGPGKGRRRWFGEPGEAVRARFCKTAARLGLDPVTRARLWRRHGLGSLDVLERIAEAPELAAPLSDRVDYCGAEVEVMARREHILSLDDFLRRRTMLAMLEKRDTLERDPGVAAASKLLFSSSPGAWPPSRGDAPALADSR